MQREAALPVPTPDPAAPTPASTVLPTPRFAYVANSGDNTISTYSVNASTGQLRQVSYATAGTFPYCVTVQTGERPCRYSRPQRTARSWLWVPSVPPLCTMNSWAHAGDTMRKKIVKRKRKIFREVWAPLSDIGPGDVFSNHRENISAVFEETRISEKKVEADLKNGNSGNTLLLCPFA